MSGMAGDCQDMKVNTISDMREVWKRAGQNGGRARAQRLGRRRRQAIARKAALARWERPRNAGTEKSA